MTLNIEEYQASTNTCDSEQHQIVQTEETKDVETLTNQNNNERRYIFFPSSWTNASRRKYYAQNQKIECKYWTKVG